MTRRPEGVLGNACLVGNGSPLPVPLIARVACDVGERLLRAARRAEQWLPATFQVAAADRPARRDLSR
ncbi:hypothetical protein DIZ27_34940 [Streptomyces sp. NWU339]|uniref:hypothetical protein n=1 Tax=Streptomyces sp. NWU339 TaxID=2185284 RepID=UPI000D679DC0|nr:hypothetical protein [Streptomyces sp. NWU339]PWI06219.1 hypothetical protein DIZ27_34940 [Streptomyces sp. NWU339]